MVIVGAGTSPRAGARRPVVARRTVALCGTLALAAAGVVVGVAGTAAAVAPDTYVATTGSDAAACTPTAPCATVAAAAARVAAGGTVHLAAGWYAGPVNLPEGLDVTVAGAGEQTSVLDGQRAGSTVTVGGGSTVRLRDLAVVDGTSPYGGGISSTANLTLENVEVAFNAATEGGGGIYTEGHLTLHDTIVADNQAVGIGGGIYSDHQLDINDSLLQDNNVTGASFVGGAGIFDEFGPVTISDSTIAGNQAPSATGGAMTVLWGSLIGSHLTITGNRAAGVGGLMLETQEVRLDGSILAGNTGGNCAYLDPFDAVVDYDLDTDGTCEPSARGSTPPVTPPVGDLVGADPKLGALQDNGGPTETEALAATSPAHSAIPAANPLCDGADQRGTARRFGNSTGCDIGAYQIPTGPGVRLSPAALDFGAVLTGAVRPVALTNDGGSALHITSFTVDGDQGYAVTGTDCPQGGAALPPGASCTVTVALSGGPGTRAGSLAVSDDSGTRQQTLALSGTVVVAPTNTVAPTVTDSVPPLPGGLISDTGTLTADPGTWVGAGPIAYAIRWQRCDPVDGTCDPAPVGTGSTYRLGPDDVGWHLRAAVTATNSAGTGEADSGRLNLVVAVAP
jgi:hypothetical protein